MSKTWIASVSFLAGILVANAIGKLGYSVLAQSSTPSESTKRMSSLGRNLEEGNNVTGTSVPDFKAVPRIPELEKFPVVLRSVFMKGTKLLDGLDCRDCTFADEHFIYGGGAFNLENAHFDGAMSIEYTGAAANTINVLSLIKFLQKPTGKVEQPENNKTIKRKNEIKRKPSDPISFGPSFIGTK